MGAMGVLESRTEVRGGKREVEGRGLYIFQRRIFCRFQRVSMLPSMGIELVVSGTHSDRHT